jgi:hypothetical protein
MAIRPATWMFAALGVQLALALGGLVYVAGLADAMAQHRVALAADDVPLAYPAIAVVVFGGAALYLAGSNRRLAAVLALAPFPVAALVMAWSWS